MNNFLKNLNNRERNLILAALLMVVTLILFLVRLLIKFLPIWPEAPKIRQFFGFIYKYLLISYEYQASQK